MGGIYTMTHARRKMILGITLILDSMDNSSINRGAFISSFAEMVPAVICLLVRSSVKRE